MREPIDPDRRLILEQSARTVTKLGREALNLRTVATQAGVGVEKALSLYPTEGELFNGLTSYVRSRFEYYTHKEMDGLGPAASPTEILKRAGFGYFHFSQEEKYNFGTYVTLHNQHDFPVQFGTEFPQESKHPYYYLLLKQTKAAITELGGPQDGWLLSSQSLAMFAAVHGFCHLATFGNLKVLSPAAKKQTLAALIETLVNGVVPTLRTGKYLSLEPLTYATTPAKPVDYTAPSAPSTSQHKLLQQLLRSGIKQFAEQGRQSLTLQNSAENAGISMDDARRLCESDEAFIAELECALDSLSQDYITTQREQLPPGACPLSHLKASGFGYIAFAIDKPESFITLISVASRSLVPVNFDMNLDTGGSGQAFSGIMEIAREVIRDSEHPHSPWMLYSQAVALWSTIHGLAHLFSLGELRALDSDIKLSLISPVLDSILHGFARTLHLDIGGHNI